MSPSLFFLIPEEAPAYPIVAAIVDLSGPVAASEFSPWETRPILSLPCRHRLAVLGGPSRHSGCLAPSLPLQGVAPACFREIEGMSRMFEECDGSVPWANVEAHCVVDPPWTSSTSYV